MRAMPFRVASEASVRFSEPVLRIGDDIIQAGEPVPSWDYLSRVSVVGSFTVDADELCRTSGLGNGVDEGKVVSYQVCELLGKDL